MYPNRFKIQADCFSNANVYYSMSLQQKVDRLAKYFLDKKGEIPVWYLSKYLQIEHDFLLNAIILEISRRTGVEMPPVRVPVTPVYSHDYFLKNYPSMGIHKDPGYTTELFYFLKYGQQSDFYTFEL